MKRKDSTLWLLTCGWLLTSTVALIIALIVVTENHRSSSFWLRVSWTEMLILILWSSTAVYTISSITNYDSRTRLGGITPSIILVSGVYSFLSFAAMLAHALLPPGTFANNIHIIVQILLLFSAALCYLVLFSSRAAATFGLKFGTPETKTPKHLHDLLATCELSISLQKGNEVIRQLLLDIKRLREALLYSLNESTSLANTAEYFEICNEIQGFCSVLRNGGKLEDYDSRELASLSGTANEILGKLSLLAAKQVRT